MRRFIQTDSNVDQEFQDVDQRLVSLEMVDNVPIGGAFIWTGLTPPDNYLWCDGASYGVQLYPLLYKVLERRGPTPTPDNPDTFAVPDLSNGNFRFVIRAR